jgi:hypothetical protein
MALAQGKFKVYEAQSWSGLTTDNHLKSIYKLSPQKASSIVTKLLASSYGANLDSLLSRFPTKYFDSDDEFTWDLIGSSERNYPLVEARKEDGTVIVGGDTGIGAGTASFKLVFAERAFSDVNMVVGEKNEVYPMRIIDEPEVEGSNYVYTVELMGAVLNGMPGSELVASKRFSKEFSPVETTLSIKGGDISFTSPIALRNEFSAIRMQHKAPGNMKDKRVAMPFQTVDPKTGKVTQQTTWMQHVEWTFEMQYQKEKNTGLMFATTNRDGNGDYHNIGKSGHIIKMGSGIREQMEVSNTLFYNVFSLKLLTSMLAELSEGKLSMDERHFVLRTGERGAIQFHNSITSDGSGWQATAAAVGFDNTGTSAMKKVSSSLHSNAYSAGFQFTEYLAPNNIKVTLEVDGLYDDKVRNKVLHPDGGVAESYRYDILDIGTIDGEPNIQKAMVRGVEDIRRWESGLRNPFTAAPSSELIGNAVDGSVYHRACMGFGAIVRDPSRTASLIPDILS